MKVITEFIYYNLSIKEVTSTIEGIQRRHINKYEFIDNFMMSVIRHTEYELKIKNKINIMEGLLSNSPSK